MGHSVRAPASFARPLFMPTDPSTSSTSSKPRAPRSSLFVGSAEKIFQVLHAFDGPDRHMTLADIVHRTGLDRSAAQRMVYTLETLGYVRRITNTRNYGLTPKVLQFSYNYVRANELIDKASPYLLDTSRRIGETANLQELDGHEIVFVARFPGQHLVNIDIVVGSRLPALFTASGTAILGRLPDEQFQSILSRTRLERITPYTETNPKKLQERVKRAAQRGYAIVMNETVMGDISVAAPVTDHRGAAVAAINISVPTSRWTVERVESELVQHVQVVATSISKAKFSNYTH